MARLIGRERWPGFALQGHLNGGEKIGRKTSFVTFILVYTSFRQVKTKSAERVFKTLHIQAKNEITIINIKPFEMGEKLTIVNKIQQTEKGNDEPVRNGEKHKQKLFFLKLFEFTYKVVETQKVKSIFESKQQSLLGVCPPEVEITC